MSIAASMSQAGKTQYGPAPAGVIEHRVNEAYSAEVASGVFTIATSYSVDDEVRAIIHGPPEDDGTQRALFSEKIGTAFQSYWVVIAEPGLLSDPTVSGMSASLTKSGFQVPKEGGPFYLAVIYSSDYMGYVLLLDAGGRSATKVLEFVNVDDDIHQGLDPRDW